MGLAEPRSDVQSAMLICAAILVAYALAKYAARKLDRFAIGRTHFVKSRVDGMEYRVHGGHDKPLKAADTLATLNARVIDLMRSVRDRYITGQTAGYAPARRAAAAAMLSRYNPDNLTENSPNDPSGDTSYTIDKGATVALCLRERDPTASGDANIHDIHDLDTLTFVTIHEIAHIAIDDIDHPPRFWEAFKFLLEEAELAGIFVSPRYAANPRQYCGIRIDYNPRWDPSVASL